MKRQTKQRTTLTTEQKQKIKTETMKDRLYPPSPSLRSQKRQRNKPK